MNRGRSTGYSRLLMLSINARSSLRKRQDPYRPALIQGPDGCIAQTLTRPRIVLYPAIFQDSFFVSLAETQLQPSLQRQQTKKPEEKTAGYHWSRTSSAQKAGPIAVMRPKLPGGGWHLEIVWSSTKSTDADDMFPTLARVSRLILRASESNPSPLSIAWITFGPPGWAIQ